MLKDPKVLLVGVKGLRRYQVKKGTVAQPAFKVGGGHLKTGRMFQGKSKTGHQGSKKKEKDGGKQSDRNVEKKRQIKGGPVKLRTRRSQLATEGVGRQSKGRRDE